MAKSAGDRYVCAHGAWVWVLTVFLAAVKEIQVFSRKWMQEETVELSPAKCTALQETGSIRELPLSSEHC